MKKIFTKNLCLYMVVAMALTVLFIFSLQTCLNQRDNTRNSYEKLETVKEKLISNDEVVNQLKQSLSDNALAKTRAFAYMLEKDPELAEDRAELERVCGLLGVDELHIVDGKGIITQGTVDDYIGFDMAGGDQTKEFLDILKDPALEIAQEPQPNATKGILFQYTGAARSDAPGLVQVGIRPAVLEEMLEGTSVDVVLSSFDFGTDGYIFAINREDNLIAAHKDSSLIGKDAQEAGFPEGMAPGKGEAKINGVKGYYVAEEYKGMLIGTMMPANEYYSVRLNQTIVVSSSMFVIFIALILMINRLVNRKIVIGIHHITDGLQTITDGNLDMIIEEKANPEFVYLSDSINQMVDGIKRNMRENEKLLFQQKEDMEKNEALIREVKEVCRNIENVSRDTLENAKSMHIGTEEQQSEVERLNATMQQLTGRLKDSAATSDEISNHTNESVKRMLKAKDKMELLMKAIQETSDTSMQIVTIIDEIQSIASQTNMLSLNASIEAARAGEMGKGFAVVASQVGELAARSAKAAQETTELIHNTVEVVTKGKNIAGTVVEEFLNVVSEMERESENIMQIAQMADGQVGEVLSAAEGLDKIAAVVQNNVEISKDSEQTSEVLAAETTRLYDIVGANV